MGIANTHGIRTEGPAEASNEQTTVRLPPVLLQKLRVDAALQRGVSMSSIVEAALREYYESRKAHSPPESAEYPE